MFQISLCVMVMVIMASISQALVTPFSLPCQNKRGNQRVKSVLFGEGTGGWGIGNSREMVPEEFSNRGERRAFEGYKLSNRGDFMQQVKKDVSSIVNDEMDELMGVAKIAGIQVKDPNTRLNKFGKDFQDDDDLDLSVPLDE